MGTNKAMKTSALQQQREVVDRLLEFSESASVIKAVTGIFLGAWSVHTISKKKCMERIEEK